VEITSTCSEQSHNTVGLATMLKPDYYTECATQHSCEDGAESVQNKTSTCFNSIVACGARMTINRDNSLFSGRVCLFV